MEYVLFALVALFGLNTMYKLITKRTLRRLRIISKLNISRLENNIKTDKDKIIANIIFYTIYVIKLITAVILIHYSIIGILETIK